MFRRVLLIRAIMAFAGLAAAVGLTGPAAAADRFIVVGSTTSTQDSGLFGWLLPAFTKASGVEVRIVAKGTGEAIKLGQSGDADVLFHDAQFTDAEYRSRVGWGHAALSDFVAYLAEAAPRRALMFHHDPAHSDTQLETMLAEVHAAADGQAVELAHEGLELELGL